MFGGKGRSARGEGGPGRGLADVVGELQILDPAVRTAQPPAQPRAGDILGPPAPGACPLASSNLQFTLTGVEFTGIMDPALQGAYAGLVGRQIPVSAICEIRDRATAILFARATATNDARRIASSARSRYFSANSPASLNKPAVGSTAK